jgi:secreted trypsin-like serine protease
LSKFRSIAGAALAAASLALSAVSGVASATDVTPDTSATSTTSVTPDAGAASATDVTPNVIGGTPATEARTVSLQSESATGVLTHRCGATLIDARWALTAAHCEEDVRGGRARVGSVTWNAGGQLVKISNIYANPLHNSAHGFGDDSALVELATAINPVDQYTRPIAIRRAGPVGTRGRTAGWGLVCDTDLSSDACTSQRPTALQQLEQQRIPDQAEATDGGPPKPTCNLVNRDGVQLNDPATMNCVANLPRDKRAGTCFGDSGSGWLETRDGAKYLTGIDIAVMNVTEPVPHACSQTPTGEYNRDAVTDVWSQLDKFLLPELCARDAAAGQRVALAAQADRVPC